MITRRQFTVTALASAIAGVAAQAVCSAAHAQQGTVLASPFEMRLAQIEAQVGGRLGVAILDTASGKQVGWRMYERFPMCSTFKILLASLVLMRTDHGQEDLTRKIVFSKREVVPSSPVSGPRADSDGMTIAELCEAALTHSDNTAGNLLLTSVGGPTGLTAFARSIGDKFTRLDRNEPALNEAAEGDPRDSTTPAAILSDMHALLLGSTLSSSSRDQLIAWLVSNKTGDARLRARLPKDWRIGDKTGTGDHGTVNDIAVVWPAGRAPVFVGAYLTGATNATSTQRDEAIAKTGELVTEI